MGGAMIEPRKVMWALAEVWWADATGAANHARATIEDMSASGACLRVKAPIQLGARIKVKWHREQFAAIARNCRSDGTEFLLGVRRDRCGSEIQPTSRSSGNESDFAATPHGNDGTKSISESLHSFQHRPEVGHSQRTAPLRNPAETRASQIDQPAVRAAPGLRNSILADSSPPPGERNPMQPKNFIPNFWRHQPDTNAPERIVEVPVNHSKESAIESASPARSELLSYEDIYHAAGIMTPSSGYGIHKVVDMLNSERIRELSKDVKRASVLMALDAAGAPVEELLGDARERQRALDAYEERQRKQLEEFEARKTGENAQIQAEMERVTAHYAERIQRNREQVTQAKEALHNWQMAKQGESQRISEVIEVCAQKPAAGHTMPAVHAGDSDPTPSLRPTLLTDASGRS
jgi:hypothetical protein